MCVEQVQVAVDAICISGLADREISFSGGGSPPLGSETIIKGRPRGEGVRDFLKRRLNRFLIVRHRDIAANNLAFQVGTIGAAGEDRQADGGRKIPAT